MQRFLATIVFCLSVFLTETAAANPMPAPPLEVATPVLSPDGKTLIFTSNAQGTSDIFQVAANAADPRKTLRPMIMWIESNEYTPDWSPDGTSIVFSSTRESKKRDIWITSKEGTNHQRLTKDAGNNTAPKFSPDGKLILFLSDRAGKREIWTMMPNGADQLAAGLKGMIVNEASWSPDGKKVVYTACIHPPIGGLANVKCNLYMADFDEKRTLGADRIITPECGMCFNPHWGENGIIFSRMYEDGYDVHVISPEGKDMRRLTKGDLGLEMSPRWASDGKSVVFSASKPHESVQRFYPDTDADAVIVADVKPYEEDRSGKAALE